MVNVSALIGCIAVLSFAIAGPIKPPDDRTSIVQANLSPVIDVATQPHVAARFERQASGNEKKGNRAISNLQAELDTSLKRRPEFERAKLVRRTDPKDENPGAEASGAFESEDRDSAIQGFELQPEDPEFEPLVNFLQRNERLLAQEKVPREAAGGIEQLHRTYRAMYPTEGYSLKDYSASVPMLLQGYDHNIRVGLARDIIQ